MDGVAHLWLATNRPLLERGFNVELFVCPHLYLIEEFNNSCRAWEFQTKEFQENSTVEIHLLIDRRERASR